MSKRNNEEFWVSKRAKNPSKRPAVTHPGGRSTPDLPSSRQVAVDPHFDVQPVPEPRTSDPSTPNQQPIPDPYPSGQRVLERMSSGQRAPALLSNRQPTVDAHFGGQPTLDPGSTRSSTLNPQRNPDPYPDGWRALHPRSSSQSTPDPRTSGQSTPNQRRITDQYGNQPLPQATSGGRPGPYSSIQLTPELRSGQRTPNLSSSDQPKPDPRPGGQNTPNPHSIHQSIVDPYPGGQRNLELPTSGRRARDPRSSGQRTPDLRPSGQSISIPRSSVQPTSNQQDSIDPYPDSQRILESNSSGRRALVSGQSIDNGIYIITNVKHDTLVFLPDPNHRTPLQGHFRRKIPGELWRVEERVKQRYSLQSVGHKTFANSGPRAQVGDSVEGDSKEQLWRIQECSEGQFMISTTDTKVCWALPLEELETPVELSGAYADPKCWWTFTKLADDGYAETAIVSETLEASLRRLQEGTGTAAPGQISAAGMPPRETRARAPLRVQTPDNNSSSSDEQSETGARYYINRGIAGLRVHVPLSPSSERNNILQGLVIQTPVSTSPSPSSNSLTGNNILQGLVIQTPVSTSPSPSSNSFPSHSYMLDSRPLHYGGLHES